MTLSILLIDDDALALDATVLTLLDAGHQVASARDWVAAAKCLEAATPDLAITDLQAPGVGDATLVAQIREIAPQLPILAISGGDDAVFAKARLAGADASLRKPFDWPALEQAMRAALRRECT